MSENITKIMEEVGTPTLKAIAKVFDLPATRLYGVAKQPKEGVAYDPKVYNWEAIQRFIERRLEPDTDLATLEQVIAKAVEITKELSLQDGRRSAGTPKEMITVDGEEIQKRKFAEWEGVGTKICLKKDPSVYEIVFQTDSSTAMKSIKQDGSLANHKIKVISNFMLNMKGVRPEALEGTIEQNFAAMAEE
nr:MAG TPA: hypothetical protein [Caudoviricetes sp.]